MRFVISRVLIPFALSLLCVNARATEVAAGRLLLYNGDYAGAAELFSSALKSDPASLEVNRLYQDAMFASGDLAKKAVAEHYRIILDANPKQPASLYLYGRCLSCEPGTGYFNRALKISPCFAWALNARGACRFENGDIVGAKHDFLRATECDPGFGEAYRNLAEAYAKDGSFIRAQKVYRKLIGRDRKNSRSWEWFGDFQLARSKWDYAAQAYRKAAAGEASDPGVYFKLGYACFQKQDYAASAAAYMQSIKHGNRKADVHYNLASAFEMQQKFEEAIKHYTVAFEKSGNLSALYSTGNCAVRLGLYSLAIRSYEQFLKSSPGSVEALFGLANAYQLKKDFDRAIKLYKDILARDSSFSRAYFNMGSVYAYHIKNPDESRKYWSAYIDKFPQSEDADFIRAEIDRLPETGNHSVWP